MNCIAESEQLMNLTPSTSGPPTARGCHYQVSPLYYTCCMNCIAESEQLMNLTAVYIRATTGTRLSLPGEFHICCISHQGYHQ
ncbi:hypothetical protein JYU34_000152 [Plutella xylostella]|uniref:Uncharacterized protein n=1 Tax=Plutella xylostella TaxID=51655 RepID=A0ABQ7R705_PLUXY|nr:hypothetical protein JYU34_000152 [Plutella xylostella]